MQKLKNLLVILLVLVSVSQTQAITREHALRTSSIMPKSVYAVYPAQATHKTLDKLSLDPPHSPAKSQLVALVLAVTLGYLGVHRLYLGYITIGIIQLLLTLSGIGFIISYVWAIIDAINIARGTLKPADGSPYIEQTKNNCQCSS